MSSTKGKTLKLKIKPFKRKVKLPVDFTETSWAKLRGAVAAVHGKIAVPTSREELYQLAKDMCVHKLAADLYGKLRGELDVHITSRVAWLAAQGPDQDVFLKQVEEVWHDHCDTTLTIRSLFLYLDRTYVIQTPSVRSIWDLGLTIFREEMQRRPEVGQKIVAGILQVVERERRGETVNRPLVKTLVRMFLALGIYSDRLQPQILDATRGFYQDEGQQYVESCDTATYLLHVEKRLSDEGQRVLHYLDQSTKTPLVHILEEQLIAAHTQSVLDKGFHSLLDGQRHEDVKRLHRLFRRVGATDQERASFEAYVKKKGLEIVMDPQRDPEMVSLLLDFRARLEVLHVEAFVPNEGFTQTVKSAFEHVVNARQNRPAELIAKFVDVQLRSGNKGSAGETEIEALLDRVMVLFQLINGKDVFEAFYKKDLAKRLLLDRSASYDMERSMISKLKTECGNAFTSKLEGMFKDIDLSKDIMGSFRASQFNASRDLSKDVDLSVQVLTTGYWPAYPVLELNLPPIFVEAQKSFADHYLTKHQGRRLCWQHSLGHCIVRARFPKANKELQLSLFQSIVLMLFGDTDELGFKEIKDATALDDQELRRTLQSMACGKVRVLRKRPKGKDVLDGDSFTFPLDFKHKLFRIKVNTIQLKETREENKGTHERVVRNRQYQIDAAVVRIMKTRKQLTHALLMSELYNQLRFPATPQDLKKRIESLIDREYLERDEENSTLYNYLA